MEFATSESLHGVSQQQIMTLDDRKRLLDQHPVREKEYSLPTPMLRDAYNIIRNRVAARRTGLVFFAAPRTGKSKCAEAAATYLRIENPKLYVLSVNAERSTRASDSHVYQLILGASRHRLSSRTTGIKLLDTLHSDVVTKVGERNGKQFILMIDEFQLLNTTDLQCLVCLHNRLESSKIKMTTISFAQPEIVHRRTSLLSSNDTQIIARMLSEMVQYSGCGSCDTLRSLLTLYDEDSEYPDGSGWTYTRFFAQVAYDAGFRLEKYTSLLWQQLGVAAGVSEDCALPMEHVVLAIESLLFYAWEHDCEDLTLEVETIAFAVADSGLASFLSNTTGEVC